MKPPFARALLIFLVLNLCQTSPGFYVSAVPVLWEKKKKKPLWVKEKLLIMNVFSHSVFYQFGDLILLSANSLNLKETKFVVWESVNIIIIVLSFLQVYREIALFLQLACIFVTIITQLKLLVYN